ncbi:MAG: hypothetical protein VB031_06060 [Eubacteriaceae bacterium]|nr:hypothetical protein [Eubacteriaceae bacterium]
MTEENRSCPACKCADKAKEFLTKEHTPSERALIAGGIFLAGLLTGCIVAAVKKK